MTKNKMSLLCQLLDKDEKVINHLEFFANLQKNHEKNFPDYSEVYCHLLFYANLILSVV